MLPERNALNAESAFALIRDMPYQRASSRHPEAIIREWRGTCSGKHYLLDEIFRELGRDSRVIMCTHRFTLENTTHFPSELQNLIAGNSVPDVYLPACRNPIGLDDSGRHLAVQRSAPGYARQPNLQGRPRHGHRLQPHRLLPSARGPGSPNLQRTNHRRFLRPQQPGAGPVHRRDEPVVERIYWTAHIALVASSSSKNNPLNFCVTRQSNSTTSQSQ